MILPKLTSIPARLKLAAVLFAAFVALIVWGLLERHSARQAHQRAQEQRREAAAADTSLAVTAQAVNDRREVYETHTQAKAQERTHAILTAPADRSLDDFRNAIGELRSDAESARAPHGAGGGDPQGTLPPT